MASVISTRATLDDLCRVEGKAELIGGRIVHLMATGHYSNQVARFHRTFRTGQATCRRNG